MTKSDLTRKPADPSTSSHKGRPCPRLDSTTQRPKPQLRSLSTSRAPTRRTCEQESQH
ncbi:hypothetical protein V8E51_014223 [Hyaloscypha variabilis]